MTNEELKQWLKPEEYVVWETRQKWRHLMHPPTAAYEEIFCAIPHVLESLALAREEAASLRQAIINHRAQKADDRCIEDDDRLYAALGDGIKCDRRVGDKDAMLQNCARFIENRCQGGGWPSYAQLEAVVRAAIKLDECWRDYGHSHTYSANERDERRGCREALQRAVAKLNLAPKRAGIEGSWPASCVQRAFVDGAKWWQFHQSKFTAFPSEVDEMEAEAVRRYGEPAPDVG